MPAGRGRLLGAALAVCVASPASAGPVDEDLARALDAAGGADVVAYDLPAPAGAPHVRLATIASAPPAAVLAAAGDAARWGRLVPAIVEAKEVARRGDARVVAWEVEVPLANLSGTLELRATATSVELRFVDGDFAPGRLAFTAAPRADGRTTVEVDGRLDVRRSTFVLRHAIARSPWGEAAALSTAAWVALRAVALRAEHAGDAVAARPTAPLVGSPPASASARALFAPALAALAARGAAALVHVAPTGRLAAISVAVPTRGTPSALGAHLADARTWRAFPGWKRVIPMPPVGAAPPTILVQDNIPLCDLDATWQRAATPTPTWTAIAGEARGAWFSWEVAPAGGAAALTMSPRLERLGSIPRRFVEAEPLLEHGLALALVFVDAVSATR